MHPSSSWLPGVPNWAVLLFGLLLLLVVIALVARFSRRRARVAAGETKQAEALPPPTPPLVQLPPSEAESAAREQALAARARADELASERARLEAEGHGAEARALKGREEEAKRDEYRAKKAAEREAKERRQREVEEAERLRAEAEARARAEAEAAAAAEAVAERVRVQAQAGQTLAQGLARTREQGFIGRLNRLFGGERPLDESALGELEEVLFTADIGVRTATRLVDLARERAGRSALKSAQKLKDLIRAEVERILDLPVPDSLSGGGTPHVTMVIGVNGAGKTTTIGKLAAQRTALGDKVVLAAGDTFRAAATEQLDVWAERAGAELVKGADGSDPGSVVFEAVKRAQTSGASLVIADTAGRLHTKAPLMEELKKVKRVLGKALPGAPHEVLLVLDATMGQNAIAQAREFHEAVGVTALVLTKLDGTAKGGVVIGICDELKLPVAWIGIGEKVTDLRRFSAPEFVAALFDESSAPYPAVEQHASP